MTTDRPQYIATLFSGIVTIAVAFRALQGILKAAVASTILTAWPKYMPADFQPSVMFTVLTNVTVDAITALPVAILIVIFARVLLRRPILPVASISALLMLVIDKRVHHLVRNEYDENYLVFLLSSAVAPIALLIASYVADKANASGHGPEYTPNQAL
jgi:hypothetical protein